MQQPESSIERSNHDFQIRNPQSSGESSQVSLSHVKARTNKRDASNYSLQNSLPRVAQ